MPLSLEEVNQALQALRSANLESISKDELNRLIVNLSHHLAIVTTLDVGRVVIRSVSCKYLEENPISKYPLEVSQLSYNPDADKCGYNRASWKGETAFYGSVATDGMEPYHTSSFEVLSDLTDSANEVDNETFAVGKWVVTKALPLVHISGHLKHNEIISSHRYDSLYKSMSAYPENMIPLKMVDSYLCSEFSKEVAKDSKWQYKASAAYADFVKNDNWPGLLYPSLKTDGAGYNVALFPETLYQYLKFERAALMTYYKRGKSITNEITMEGFPDGDHLRWNEIYQYRLPCSMKNWYLGLSDDNNFQKFIPHQDL